MIQQALNSFDEARDKLVKNRGSVVRQAEILKQLGVKRRKVMPRKRVDLWEDEERALPLVATMVEVMKTRTTWSVA